MSKSNLVTSQRNSKRYNSKSNWQVKNDCDEVIKMGYESYEDKQRRLKALGL